MPPHPRWLNLSDPRPEVLIRTGLSGNTPSQLFIGLCTAIPNSIQREKLHADNQWF